MSQLRRLLGIVVTLALATGTLITAGVGSASATPSGELTRYPYLTDLVGTKVTVNWATSRVNGPSSTGYVTWGAVGTNCAQHLAGATKTGLSIGPSNVSPAAANPEYQWQSTFDLGVPGNYCYRVFLGKSTNPPPLPIDLLGSDPSPQFATQVPAGSTEQYSFAVLGDWGSVDQNGANANEMVPLTQLVHAKHPGDTVSIEWTDSAGQQHSASVRLASGPAA